MDYNHAAKLCLSARKHYQEGERADNPKIDAIETAINTKASPAVLARLVEGGLLRRATSAYHYIDLSKVVLTKVRRKA